MSYQIMTSICQFSPCTFKTCESDVFNLFGGVYRRKWSIIYNEFPSLTLLSVVPLTKGKFEPGETVKGLIITDVFSSGRLLTIIKM